MSQSGTPNPRASGHSRTRSLASVFSTSPKKKDNLGKIRHSIDRPVVTTPAADEQRFGSAIGNRTATLPQYKDLGPPDIVHITHYNSQKKKEEGEYHYITGIDVSSTAAPMAYLSMLTLNETNVSLRHPIIYTYCTYNSFSRCDIRIRTEFPTESQGSYQLQLLPSDRRNKTLSEVSPQIWDELYVSGMVRSLITGVDIERKSPMLVEKVPCQNVSQSKYAISMFIRFLDRGAQLGASDKVNKPSIQENYLIDALMILTEFTGLHGYAIEELKKSGRSDMDLIIIKLLFASNQEIEAVRYMHSALKSNPRDALLLIEQTKFLIKKGETELALKTALRAVRTAPLSSDAWSQLTLAHILKGDLKSALISLNSIPMYGIRSKDFSSPGLKDELRYPEPIEGKVKSVWEDLIQVWGPRADNLIEFCPKHEVQAVDPALLRINRQKLKGTHAEAYELLIIMINQAGWDGLLKARSEVFLMAEEFENMSTTSLAENGDAFGVIKKRQCERWLDDLFLVLYEDLRVVLIVENELQNQRQLKHSALEWELIGLTGLRTHHFKNAVAALRTALNVRFDIISARSLIQIWELRYLNKDASITQSLMNNGSIDMSLDVVLDVIMKVIAYNIRFYNEFSLDVVLFLKRFFAMYDSELVQNKIQVQFENDNNDYKNSGVIPPFDKMVALIHTFNPDL
ncbi:Chitin biosynthesis protein CHS6 [Cyberlindnera fabianii]|uniref:Chitin biosynthesis protein CHS6 n=1 Tax=Cyberlindnera fabianii TaxID=36022 RepID=A0A1V2L3W3_CYBFA|nr:Chitin biosynthesis protein CHS6 [Cyberlindnera fabianii]